MLWAASVSDVINFHLETVIAILGSLCVPLTYMLMVGQARQGLLLVCSVPSNLGVKLGYMNQALRHSKGLSTMLYLDIKLTAF